MFLKKIRFEKIGVSICMVSIFLFALSGFLQADKGSEKNVQQSIAISAPEPLKYGDNIYILNGYDNWNGGYLDTRGSGCEGNYLCVSTAWGYDRDGGSGTWKIMSAAGKQNGQPVMALDDIYLLNQWHGNGGYLDTRGGGCEGNQLCVSTSTSSNRDNGSGTWKIIPESLLNNGVIYTDQVVRFLNGYSDFKGGFLDTRGSGCEGNRYCVSTYLGWNRDGRSTSWKIYINKN